MRAALVLLLSTTCLVFGVGPSSASAACSMQGPAWTSYPAHGSAVYHGTTYVVVINNIGCSTAKGYIKRIFAKNHNWPYAGSGSMALKGGPSGWRCSSSVESRRNRKSYAGDCLGGTGASDLKHFAWTPRVPAI